MKTRITLTDIAMKTSNASFLSTIILLFVMSACGFEFDIKKGPSEYWITYDPINGYKEPSETSEVVKEFTNTSFPFEITGKDATGKWGKHVIHGYFGSQTVWMPLDQMFYAGSDDYSEELDTYVVKVKEMRLHKHPKNDKKEEAWELLHQGDTLQVTDRVDGWLHVRKIQYRRTAYASNRFGWVPENTLQQIETLSSDEVDKSAYRKAEKREEERREERNVKRFGEENSKKISKAHSIYGRLCQWLGIFSIIIWLIFRRPAANRGVKFDLVVVLILGLLLIVSGWLIKGPSWFFALLIPIMVFVALYPLLYLRSGLIFEILYPLVSLALSGIYLYLYSNQASKIWVLIILGAIAVVITFIVFFKISDDVCPICGYYANHHSDAPQQVGPSRTSVSTNPYKRYVKTTTEKSGNTTIITDHYETGTTQTVTTTTNYKILRTCARCGATFTNHKTVTTSRTT